MDLEDDFKQAYPNLSRELSEDDGLDINSVRTSADEGEKAAAIPTVTDHLRRCETRDEALEIIEYFARTTQITEEHYRHLKRQLVSQGLRSFGSKRDPGDIEKDGL